MYLTRGNLFLFVLLINLLVQGTLWRMIDLTDGRLWINRANYLEEDLQHRPLVYKASDARGERYGGQPGMAVVTGSLLARKLGAPILGSLQGTIAILIAGAATFAVMAGREVDSKKKWWLVSVIMLLFNPLYWRSTPTDAVMAAITVSVTMLIWALICERKKTKWVPVVLGINLGIGLVTRTTFAGLLFGLMLMYAIYDLGWRNKKWLWVIGATIVTVYIFNPLLWDAPGQHLWLLIARSVTHAVPVASWRWDVGILLIRLPIALISLGLAVIIIMSKSNKQMRAKQWLRWLLISTIIVGGVLAQANLYGARYFYPLIFMWEFMLPFEIWYLADRWFKNAPRPWVTKVPQIVSIILVIGYVGLTILEAVMAKMI